jgi:hypothetical protein
MSVLRVAMFGPESTGKTSLAEKLAARGVLRHGAAHERVVGGLAVPRKMPGVGARAGRRAVAAVAVILSGG